jgi:hypothetical protein
MIMVSVTFYGTQPAVDKNSLWCVFQQIINIPMDTNVAPLQQSCSFIYKNPDFNQGFLKKKERKLARSCFTFG